MKLNQLIFNALRDINQDKHLCLNQIKYLACLSVEITSKIKNQNPEVIEL